MVGTLSFFSIAAHIPGLSPLEGNEVPIKVPRSQGSQECDLLWGKERLWLHTVLSKMQGAAGPLWGEGLGSHQPQGSSEFSP